MCLCSKALTLTISVFRYPSISYSFLLERHSSEQAALILVPAMSNILNLNLKEKTNIGIRFLFKHFSVMASINLISLWMSPELSQRLLLLAFNILSHYLFMQQISYIVPSNGDICPNIGNFDLKLKKKKTFPFKDFGL